MLRRRVECLQGNSVMSVMMKVKVRVSAEVNMNPEVMDIVEVE